MRKRIARLLRRIANRLDPLPTAGELAVRIRIGKPRPIR